MKILAVLKTLHQLATCSSESTAFTRYREVKYGAVKSAESWLQELDDLTTYCANEFISYREMNTSCRLTKSNSSFAYVPPPPT